MQKLTRLLARLEKWLARHRKGYLEGLRPGASAAELNELEKALTPHPLPEELRLWLAWHNGQGPDVIGAFVDSWLMLGTTEIAQEWRERNKKPAPGWNNDWIPLLDDGEGDLVVMAPGKTGCPLLEVWRGRSDQPVFAASLMAWLETFVKDVTAGRYHEDPERGDFSRDDLDEK
jgi:cell wall assembly regulator SMI1